MTQTCAHDKSIQLRHRILQAYPQSEPRALQQPSLPGALNASPSQQTYSDYQPQTKLDERLIRDMVREEVRRQLSTVSAASSEHAHQDAAVEHDGKNRHHNASHGALMNVPAHQHAPHRHLRRTNTNGVNTGAGLDGAYEGAGSSRSRKLRARSSPRATGEAAGTEAELSFPSKRGRVILHRSCSPPGFHNGDDGRGNERGGAGGEEEVTPLVSITDTSKVRHGSITCSLGYQSSFPESQIPTFLILLVLDCHKHLHQCNHTFVPKIECRMQYM